jgi:ADP-ribose pyrophosphatase YjhB (NUDIX family)
LELKISRLPFSSRSIVRGTPERAVKGRRQIGGIHGMNRRYPERPYAGVGAIVFRGTEVLLIKRGSPPALGKWSIPGGLVELGESLEAAVRREVLEEVGLEVKEIDLVAVLDRVILDPNGRIEYHYILLDFLCEIVSGDLKAASDADECRFVAMEDICLYDMTRGTEEVIKRAFEKAKSPGIPVYTV